MRAQLEIALHDRYVVDRELGRGGMARVWLSRDLKHDRLVAIKVLHPELAATLGPERFQREIRTTARLDHPHILPVLDSGEAAGLLWYTMPYVRGESLRDRLRRESQLPLEVALDITRQVASALDYAHHAGVVHRDLKPENILLADDQARVADFGVAKALSEAGADQLTESGLAVGTPAYMSPEQASGGQVDSRSDVYALGCVLYEMLAGEPPYTGATAQAVLAKRLREPVPHLGTMREVPQAVEDAVTRALARAPADRYPTVSQFSQALASTSLMSSAAPRDLPIRRLWWASATALGVLALALGWWGASRARTEATGRKGVALLPCEGANRGDGAYIGDRWSEELIQKLVRTGGLNPKAWESVRRYRGTRLAPRQIGQDLDAETLVRCRVAEQPTGVHLSVELIRAHDERVIWSNDYERPAGADGINSVQSAAAREIAQELGVTLPRLALTAVERPLTRDSMALRFYRLGEHFLQSFDDPIAVRKSVDYFERAIARDSNLVQAPIGLAQAMIWRGERENLVSRDYFPVVAQQLRKSIALDPTIAEAHALLALYLLEYTHDWVGAEEEHQRALALDPNSVAAHAGYGWQLQVESRFQEAIGEYKRAVALDPTNKIARGQLVRVLDFAGQEGRAMRELREALELTPQYYPLYYHWAVMLLRRGQRDSAVAMLDDHVTTPEWYDGWLYAAAGRRDKGQQILDSLLVRNAVRPVDPLHIAAIHAGLGNREDAFKWLDRAYSDRSALLLFLLGPHPAFDALRGDLRFQELRKKVGFKQ
jgi:eukaryotic-like serine/threonine-protein kinase